MREGHEFRDMLAPETRVVVLDANDARLWRQLDQAGQTAMLAAFLGRQPTEHDGVVEMIEPAPQIVA